MCENGTGRFHHGKATNRIYGCFFISYFLAGLLTFLEVMHLNVGHNINIFVCHGGVKGVCSLKSVQAK